MRYLRVYRRTPPRAGPDPWGAQEASGDDLYRRLGIYTTVLAITETLIFTYLQTTRHDEIYANEATRQATG